MAGASSPPRSRRGDQADTARDAQRWRARGRSIRARSAGHGRAHVTPHYIVKREPRDGATAKVTAETAVMGTPGYMAPEAILGHADIDRRVGVYAVGCVAYFLLTGERMFGAANKMTVLMRHLREEPMPPSQRTKRQIPREVDEFVLACLRKDPKRRPASAEELLQMACVCKTADLWDQQAARTWWEANLPHLATPAKANTPTGDVSTGCSPVEKMSPRRSELTTLRDNAIGPNSNL